MKGDAVSKRWTAGAGRVVMCGVLLVGAVACTAPSPTAATPSAATPSAAPPTAATATRPAATATSTQASPTGTPVAATTPAATAVASHRDATYEVAGRPVTLKGGVSEVEAAPGSASKVTTRVFGNEATGDLNGDGQPDIAFLLTQSPGGSGTFFYAVAALKTATGYAGTNAVLLGDRIAPQTTRVVNGVIEVNYAERKAGEPMTAQPSVGVTKRLQVVDGKLAEAR